MSCENHLNELYRSNSTKMTYSQVLHVARVRAPLLNSLTLFKHIFHFSAKNILMLYKTLMHWEDTKVLPKNPRMPRFA